jgi:hypothetical protein
VLFSFTYRTRQGLVYGTLSVPCVTLPLACSLPHLHYVLRSLGVCVCGLLGGGGGVGVGDMCLLCLSTEHVLVCAGVVVWCGVVAAWWAP